MASKKASVLGSVSVFLAGIVCFFGFRWALYEPYVIPSGSMIPSLLIFDHILVFKSAYGLRYPFTERWVSTPSVPERGEVVVFRSVEDPEFFMVKRVIGLPGDKIDIKSDGQLFINGQAVPRHRLDVKGAREFAHAKFTDVDLQESSDSLQFYEEDLGSHPHLIQVTQGNNFWSDETYEVPEGQIFLMGDNRNQSRDSRFWGYLPLENLLGKALFVWLSCSQGLKTQQVLCDPRHIRWQRLFHKIQ